MPTSRSVPYGWRRARLGEVAEVVMGQSPPGHTVFDWDGDEGFANGLPFTQGNAEFGSQSPDPIKWCVQPAKVAESGDLLISVRAPVGETNRTSQQLAIGRGLAAIRFQRADPDFGWHAVNGAKHLLERLAQGSTFDAIGGSELNSLTLLLPPITEQRAIAAVLDSIDEAIERTEEVIAATERLRDALLHDLLTRGLPGLHTEWKEVRGLGTIPASWDVVRLGDVLTLNQPGAWGDEPTDDDPGVRVLRAADLTRDGRVHTEKAAWRRLGDKDRERRLMQDGDLILERSGGGPAAPVGRIALIEESAPIYCSNFCQHLRLDATRCNFRFAARALWHRYLRGVTERLEQRTTGIRNLDYEG
ncbi:MAG: hypothetical protein F4Y04_03675, partial [Chloroflexi bacterium]|nr:hypothetical protein [Chloroflexota bacterium]